MAFNTKQMGLLNSAIDQMRTNRLLFEVPQMTIDDIFNTFIREEDRATMQRAGELINDKYMERSIRALVTTTKFGDVRTMIRLAGTKPDGSPMFLVPAYAKDTDNPYHSVRAPADLDGFLTAYLDVRIDFNYVTRTLLQLDALCEHPAHVAFFWPSIRIIADYAMKQNEGLGSRIADMVASSTKKAVPALNPALRAACKETAEIITAAHILGKPDVPADLKYTIGCSSTHNHKRETPLGPISA